MECMMVNMSKPVNMLKRQAAHRDPLEREPRRTGRKGVSLDKGRHGK